MRTRRGGLFGFSSRKTKYMPIYKTVDSAKTQARALIRTIIDPTSSDETVVASMDELSCLATSNCVKELKGFEDARYIITTRYMQLLKTSKKWKLIKRSYEKLFKVLYQDLNPSSSVLPKKSDVEDQYVVTRRKTLKKK
jgi:hypothetical protein